MEKNKLKNKIHNVYCVRKKENDYLEDNRYKSG